MACSLVRRFFFGYTSMTRNNTVTKYLIGRSYKNDKFDWSFLFRVCVKRVMEL